MRYFTSNTIQYPANKNIKNDVCSFSVNVIRLGLETDQVNNNKLMNDLYDTIDLLVKNNMYVMILLWNNRRC